MRAKRVYFLSKGGFFEKPTLSPQSSLRGFIAYRISHRTTHLLTIESWNADRNDLRSEISDLLRKLHRGRVAGEAIAGESAHLLDVSTSSLTVHL